MVVDVATFRSQARAWLAEHAAGAPADYGAIMPRERRDEAVAWQRTLHDAGFAGIHWPAEHGGRGLSPEHTAAWQEEAARAGVPAVLNMVGLVLAAGAVLAYGTDEQKGRFLRPTARAEVVWCQLFSEPGAGSDLASLSTRAECDGDTFVVSGQKVWTSGADVSDWGILLARTDAEAPKHRGISFLLVDMASPGIEARPLRQMNGDSEFAEVFLDEVRVPAENLVGPLHGGWGVAMAALTNERGFIGASTASLARRLDALVGDRSRRRGAPDPVARDRLAGLYATGRALVALGGRQGPQASAASSLLKLGMTELTFATAMARAADAGAGATLAGEVASGVLSAPGARLGGGTSEIQRTIVGERVLGLPAEPRPPSDSQK